MAICCIFPSLINWNAEKKKQKFVCVCVCANGGINDTRHDGSQLIGGRILHQKCMNNWCIIGELCAFVCERVFIETKCVFVPKINFVRQTNQNMLFSVCVY